MTTHTNITCTACGCVCDDLNLQVREGAIASVDCKGCPIAEEWFGRIIAAQSSSRPMATVDDQAVELDFALDRAASLLSASRSPLIYGLSRSSTPGQRAAVALADRIGAVVDTTASVCHGPSIMAIQSVGESTSTLGEIRQRADLVIFWGADPVKTHPRHLERYSGLPRSEFLPGGRADRTIVVVDTVETQTAREADVFIQIEPGRDFELIQELRMAVSSLGRDESRPSPHLSSRSRETSDAVDLPPKSDDFGYGRSPSFHTRCERFAELVNLMLGCRYGVVFFGLGIAQQPLGHLSVEVLLRLVAELNAKTRFTARRLRIPGDVSGADAVLCWQTGFPFAVSLQREYPRYNPGEFTITELLRRGDVDSCLIVGSESLKDVPPDAKARLSELPTIVLDHAHQATACRSDVTFTTSIYGLHARGTAYRMDEVPLQLRDYLPSSYPTDEDVLLKLTQRLS